MNDQPELNAVDAAIRSRKSVRRFRDKPVPQHVIEQLLSVAARAPSGTNSQPWRVYALAGAVKQALSTELVQAHFAHAAEHAEEYQYAAVTLFEPYISRRKEYGRLLYGQLNIEFSENPARHKQVSRNYLFFDAPVGLIFTIHRELGYGSWLDLGMFMQNIMVSARGRGLDTCAQVSFARYHKLIKPRLGIGPQEIVVCGMALGHAHKDAPENQVQMSRVDVDEFASFAGFPTQPRSCGCEAAR